MGQYVLRRLLIAVPEPARHQRSFCSSCWRWRRAIRSAELATNPNVPPEVRRGAAGQIRPRRSGLLRYLHWLVAMLQGDWGFSFVSRINVDTLILQRLPATLYRDRLVADRWRC